MMTTAPSRYDNACETGDKICWFIHLRSPTFLRLALTNTSFSRRPAMSYRYFFGFAAGATG